MQLVGIPYEDMDCMQIVNQFYSQELGKELVTYYKEIPDTKEEANSKILDAQKDFEEVKGTRKKGDLLLISLFGVECHIAVCIDSQTMLHTTKNTGSVIDRISKWEKVIVGTYRPKQCAVLPSKTN